MYYDDGDGDSLFDTSVAAGYVWSGLYDINSFNLDSIRLMMIQRFYW